MVLKNIFPGFEVTGISDAILPLYLLTLRTLHGSSMLLKHENWLYNFKVISSCLDFLNISHIRCLWCIVYRQKIFVKCKMSLLFVVLKLQNVSGGNRKPWPEIPKIPSMFSSLSLFLVVNIIMSPSYFEL